MRSFLSPALIVLSFCASFPACAESLTWNQLVQITMQKGDTISSSASEAYKYLSHIVPNRDVTHHADYFTVKVDLQSDGAMAPEEVTAVSEQWNLQNDGNWAIEQWDYILWPNGKLVDVSHSTFTETPDGTVLDDREIPSPSVSDPALLKQWENKLDEWYQWAPGPEFTTGADIRSSLQV